MRPRMNPRVTTVLGVAAEHFVPTCPQNIVLKSRTVLLLVGTEQGREVSLCKGQCAKTASL